jgi:class 3 adenylate cyclase
MEKHSMVNMALLHRIFVIHLLCARANSRHTQNRRLIGSHGFATLGTIRFEGRFDYAAIGTVSNVASRLCDEAKPGQILISPRVRQAVEKAVTVEPVGKFALKGIRYPMAAYNVLAPSTTKPH